MQSNSLPQRDQTINAVASTIRNRNEWMREYAGRPPDAPGAPIVHALFSDDGAGMAFIVVEASQPLPDGPGRLRPLIESCRSVCANALNSSPEISGDGMHVVVMHGGDLAASDMEGLVDRSGQLATHCLSVTLVDYANGQTDQDMFWPGQILDRLQVADRARVNGTLADLRGSSPAPAPQVQAAQGQDAQSQADQRRQQQMAAERVAQRRATETRRGSAAPRKISWGDAFRRVAGAFITIYGVGAGSVLLGLLLVVIGFSNDIAPPFLLGALLLLAGWVVIIFGPYPAGLKVLTESIATYARGGRRVDMPWSDAILRSLLGLLALIGVFLVGLIALGVAAGVAGVAALAGQIIGTIVGVVVFIAVFTALFIGYAVVILKVLTDSVSKYAVPDGDQGIPLTDALHRVLIGVRALIGIIVAVVIIGTLLNIIMSIFGASPDDPFSAPVPIIALQILISLIGLAVLFMTPVAVLLKILTDSIAGYVSDRTQTMSWKSAFRRVIAGTLAYMVIFAIGLVCIATGGYFISNVDLGFSSAWFWRPPDVEDILLPLAFGVVGIMVGIFWIAVGFFAVILKTITDSVVDAVSA